MLFDLGYPATEYKSDRPGYRGTSMQEFFRLFPDQDACLRHVFNARFGQVTPCPRCGRQSRWHHIRGTKRFQQPCGHAISPLAGTLFERSSIPLQLWFYAMLHFANSRFGVTSTFLRRHMGLSHKAAYRMADRIRTQMAAIDLGEQVGQHGEQVEVRIKYLEGIRTSRFPTRGSAKAVIIADAASAQATLIGRSRRHVLRRIIADKVTLGAVPVTTCPYTHAASSEFGSRAPFVTLVDEFVDPESGTNPIRSYINFVRRPMHNTYRRVDFNNLWKYLKELEFAFNRRRRSNETFPDMISKFPDFGAASLATLERWSSRDDRFSDSHT